MFTRSRPCVSPVGKTALMTGQDWVKGDWTHTFTGKKFYPLNPQPEDIDIRDIAHALAMTCRYNGHVQQFYSVAEHCVLLSHAVPQEDALWMLLHDAAEAYAGDMVRPIKRDLPDFSVIEDRILTAIAAHLNLPVHPRSVFPEHLKDYDNRILLDERAQVLTPTAGEWPMDGREPLGVTLSLWSPKEAEQAYLDRFHELTK